MNSRIKQLAAAVAMVSIVGCAGKTAHPVPQAQIGDDQMSCNEIQQEQAHIKNQINKLIPESKKGIKNTALGVTGIFLIVPWFFMDFSDAEKVEIQAYQERSHKLSRIAARKNCPPV